jgi:prepilin-type N-terminal cleavage/methylation domain-containing protein
MKYFLHSSQGFTLIEVILSLIIAGILGSMLVTFTGTALTRSSEGPLNMVRFYERNQILDNITVDYRSNYIHRTDNGLNDLLDAIKLRVYDTPFATVTAAFIRYSDSSPPEEQTGNQATGILRVTVTPATGIDGADMVALYTR